MIIEICECKALELLDALEQASFPLASEAAEVVGDFYCFLAEALEVEEPMEELVEVCECCGEPLYDEEFDYDDYDIEEILKNIRRAQH